MNAFLSVKEAAEIKNVRREAILLAIRQGRLKAQRVGQSGQYMIDPDDLAQYWPRPYRGKRVTETR